jgi:hypothetical protein
MPKKKTSSYRGTASEHGSDFKVNVDEEAIRTEHRARHIEEMTGRFASDDEVSIIVTDSKPKQKSFPRLYVLIDKDMAPVSSHLRERDAYTEKNEFAEAGIVADVVIYEPLLGRGR